MKNSLTHLPEIKRKELALIVDTIRKGCDDVEMIILFGSYARGDYKEKKDLENGRKSGHVSDYDILIVTNHEINAVNAGTWQKISNQCRKLGLSADPRILIHDITELNNKLSVGQYFYTDVKKEGVVLYDSKKFELAEKRKLSEEENKEIAREHFGHWFKNAKEFFIDYKNAFERGAYNKAAFELHQAAEHAYKTIILVFTNYNPNEHFLIVLGEECEKFSPEIKKLFPQNNYEEKDRFKLLEYAYIGGRYDPKYKISKEDLRILSADVKKLLDITQRICGERVK